MTKQTEALLNKVIPSILARCAIQYLKGLRDTFDYEFNPYPLSMYVKQHISTRGYDLDCRVQTLTEHLLDMEILNDPHHVSEKNYLKNARQYAAKKAPVYKYYGILTEYVNPEAILYVLTHREEYLTRYKDNCLEVISVSQSTAYTISVLHDYIEGGIRSEWAKILHEMGKDDVVESIRRFAVQRFLESIPTHINSKSVSGSSAPEHSPKFLLEHADLIEYEKLYPKGS
jgi:hypothetical protein